MVQPERITVDDGAMVVKPSSVGDVHRLHSISEVDFGAALASQHAVAVGLGAGGNSLPVFRVPCLVLGCPLLPMSCPGLPSSRACHRVATLELASFPHPQQGSGSTAVYVPARDGAFRGIAEPWSEKKSLSCRRVLVV